MLCVPRLRSPAVCPSLPFSVISRYILLLFNLHNFNSYLFYVLFLSVNLTQTFRPRVDLVLSCVKLLVSHPVTLLITLCEWTKVKENMSIFGGCSDGLAAVCTGLTGGVKEVT